VRNRTKGAPFPYSVSHCAIINCRQSVVYAGDRRSNLVRHAPLEGKMSAFVRS